jgi:hypothetical protein
MEKTFYERLIPSQKARSIINRLVKAFIFGAIGNIGLITIVMPKNWQEITTVLAMFSFAAIAGGITGVLSALQKWYSWKE